MSVAAVCPWLGGCPHREGALEFISDLYPWPLTIAPGGTPWVKAEAVRPAIEESSADVVVVADADCWTQDLERAVLAVTCGAADWAVPHAPDVRRLSPEGTKAVLAGEPWDGLPLEVPPYPGVLGGGILVALREVLLNVPMDPRFTGFGQEDVSWGYALRALIGEPWRGKHPLFHLWHPAQERLDRRYGSVENRALGRRYFAARKDPDAMRNLIGEHRCLDFTPTTPTSS